MIDMLKRHEIQVLRRAGLTQSEIAKVAGVSIRSIRRVESEPVVQEVDDRAERERRAIGRPAKAEPFRAFVTEILTREPELLSVEILRRARLAEHTVGKTALYDLIRALRPTTVRPLVRFEGLPGEFSQHDFGQVDVRFLDGTRKRVHFFASRIDDLSAAFRGGRLADALASYIHPGVLIVDEVGYLTYGTDAANMLFHVVNDRHRKKRAMIFTTNKRLTAWGRGTARRGPGPRHRRSHPRAWPGAHARRTVYAHQAPRT